jgi:hypothetical protein
MATKRRISTTLASTATKRNLVTNLHISITTATTTKRKWQQSVVSQNQQTQKLNGTG